MIVNIRGTGGAGKSTAVKAVMLRYGVVTPVHVEGRRRPVGYVCERAVMGSGSSLFVVGHYETACGGGDTIKTPSEVFELARRYSSDGLDVLFEGIISQDDVRRTVELSKDYDLTVVVLTTTLADCLAGIEARRAARGDSRPLDPSNTESRARRLAGHVRRLREAGVRVLEESRETAVERVAALLRLP